ncbi:MAG: hypothetical protein L0332_34300 [Chloroflexi bacterium]|nr:hypothetical protein [Chloroflexota bacterium]MCI0731769.1 hypothetical protein [Chloroflexota bacterium]
MQPYLIQFNDLDDLAAEIPAGHVVRVTALDITEATFDGVAELRIAGIGVHIRAISPEGHLLACYLPVARLQVFGRPPRPDDPTRKEYEEAWEKTKALRQRVSDYLAGKGFEMRPGVIYLGDVAPMYGGWSSDPGQEEASG